MTIREITIGDCFIPRRGRRDYPHLMVRQVHRRDRLIDCVTPDGERKTMVWAHLQRDWRHVGRQGTLGDPR